MNHWTAPRRCDVAPWAVTQFPEHAEAWELNAMARQAADEKAASARYHQAAEAASEFQGDEPKTERAPGWQMALVYGMSALAAVSAIYAVWPYIAGLL